MDKRDKAILVCFKTHPFEQWEEEDVIDELTSLADTAFVSVLACEIVPLKKIVSSTYLGTGKAKEIAELAGALDANVIIFNTMLSPAQVKNLLKIIPCTIIDRPQLILDIFARRARTNEAKLQVELAQLNYLLPRLTRLWLHLSRQKGGIGLRGPGETQLETDRRLIRQRIKNLKNKLDHIENQRDIQRKQRTRQGHPLVAIVGYTNVGKTTLFNALAEESKLVENRLFATLDPSIRTFTLPSGYSILLSDTVGFIKDLPHELIESFKATLEEVIYADILLHVTDISDHMIAEKIAAVNTVLKELDADNKETILVLNKSDLVEDTTTVDIPEIRKIMSVVISAAKKTGIESLLKNMDELLSRTRKRIKLKIPYNDSSVLTLIHREASIKSKKYTHDIIEMEVELPEKLVYKLQKYIT